MNAYKYLSKEGEGGGQWKDKRQWAQIKIQRILFRNKKKISPIYCKGYQTLEQFGRTADVFSIWGDIQNLTGHAGHTPGNLLQHFFFFFNEKIETFVLKSEFTETPHAWTVLCAHMEILHLLLCPTWARNSPEHLSVQDLCLRSTLTK